MASSVGMKLVSSVLSVGDLKDYYQLNIDPRILKTGEDECWEFIRSFVVKHKALPKPKTVKHELDGVVLPSVEEIPSYYAHQLKERYVSESIGDAYKSTKEFLIKGNMKPDKAIEVLTEVLVRVNMMGSEGRLVDFRMIEDLVKTEYKNKKNKVTSTVKIGYPSVDNLAGGSDGDDLISIVGRPAMGKTMNSMYCAHNVWWQQKKSVAVVSMEMNTVAIAQRMVSLHTKKKLSYLKKAQLSTKDYKSMITQLSGLKDHDSPLWLMDGHMSATVEDIWKMCQQMKPEFLIIDGAYLVNHPNSRLNTYEKVAETTRMIKQALCSDLNIPVMCSWQFSRDATKKLKKKKDAQVGLEDIGYSDVIGQVSSLVLGLLEAESVETVHRRKINILKGRNGEVGHFYINWDFTNMNFSEIKPMGQTGHDSLTVEEKAMDAANKGKIGFV